MGNSASDIISRVAGSNSESLEKLISQDIDLLHDVGLMLNVAKLTARSDLSKYSVPGEEKVEKKPQICTDDELSLICCQEFRQAARERRDQVLSNLQVNVLRSLEPDIATTEVTKRLQALCRVFEAILRADELKKKKNKIQKSEEEGALPATAKSAIKFGLSTLLSLVECVAVVSPKIYEMVVKDTNRIAEEMGVLSMRTSDSTLNKAFADIGAFFEGVIMGGIESLGQELRVLSFGPLFRLGLCTGNIDLLASVATRLLSTTGPFQELNSSLYPALQTLSKLKPRSFLFTWNPAKKNPEAVVSEENTVLSNITTSTPTVFSIETFSSERFYFEITVVSTNENCYFGICDPNFTDLSSWNNSSYFTTCYQSKSSIFNKSKSVFEFEAWKPSDKIGVFVDMSAKTAAFYKNGVRMTGEDQKITCDSVKVYLNFAGPSEFVINTDSDYPEAVKALFGIQLTSELPLAALISSETVSEDYVNTQAGEISAYIISSLERLVKPFEYLFNSSTFTFNCPSPFLGLLMTRKVVESLHLLDSELFKCLKSRDFSRISESSAQRSLVSVQKLLRFHLHIAKDIEDTSVDSQLKQSILDLTLEISKTYPGTEISEQAVQILSSCFELFYKDPAEKLNYMLSSLKQSATHEGVMPMFKEMQSKIYTEMSRPDKLFAAFELTNDDAEAKVRAFYHLLVDISYEVSADLLNDIQADTSVINLLESTQAAILAQTGKALFKDKWLELFMDYCAYFLSACDKTVSLILSLSKNGTVPESVLSKVSSTLPSKILDELINALLLSPLDLPMISHHLPLIHSISSKLSLLSSAPSVLTLGVGIVEETYESPHNYPDNANLTHTIKTPNAIKYNLTFDPQCRTENGCDYLELWLDEAASNKFARWEGEGFPKEPVEVVNSILHFTFRSDGSVNYWGWRISIKASVESVFYKKQWPDTTKDMIELFYGFCANKLIVGQFTTAELSEDVRKTLENPLLKYGISDKCTLLAKPLVQIDPALEVIVKVFAAESSTGSHSLFPQRSLDTGLTSYLDEYKQLTVPKYSEQPFLQELFEGSENTIKAWTDLKRRSGAVGVANSIGGADMDQAERAVFAVYTAYFEVVDTMRHLFENVAQSGPTVKLFVKQSCQIRTWAQKHKQRLMDAGNAEISYKIINADVVNKCAFLLGAEYKACLKELGVTKVMKNLMSSIAKAQDSKKGLKLGSKWKAVQGAVKSMGKLKGLISIKNKANEAENEDVKEFMRVVDLVNGFLENAVTIEQITDALHVKRTKAVARVAGLLSISNLLMQSTRKHATYIVKSFSNSFKNSEKKAHYSAELEGIDPALLSSTQKAFFAVFRNLQQDLIRFHDTEFTYESFIHFSSVIEGITVPLKNLDMHMLLDQPLLATLRVLLDWSRGLINQKPLERRFLKDTCITRFALLTEDAIPEGKVKILIEKREEQPSLYLLCDRNGDEDPISELIVSDEVKEGWEDAVGKFVFMGADRWILIKRSQPRIDGSYLTEISEELIPKLSAYPLLLAPVNEDECKKFRELKERLCRSAWNLYKQLLFGILGTWNETNQSQLVEAQDMFLRAIFSEVALTPSLTDLNTALNARTLSAGSDWLGLSVYSFNQKNSMQSWLKKFYNSKPPEQLAVEIQHYIETVDGLRAGKTKSADREINEHLKSLLDSENEFDFFRFIQILKESKGLSEESLEFINSSGLWEGGPLEDRPDPLDVKLLFENLERLIHPAAENSVTRYLDLVKGNEGLLSSAKIPEGTPAEFRNSDGDLDIYSILTAVRNLSAFSEFAIELTEFFKVYPELPETLKYFDKHKSCQHGYLGSLLWTLYGGFTSSCLSNLLARDSYILPLLSFTFLSSSSTLQTISSRILARTLPTQHSPQSFSHIWASFQPLLPQESQTDIVSLLLKRIGKSVWPCESSNAAYESQHLLLSLMGSERWKTEVIDKILNNLNEGCEHLKEGKLIKATHAGSIVLLAGNECYGKVLSVLSVVSLKESNFSTGIVEEIVDSKTFMVYSVADDVIAKVDIGNVVSILPPGALSIVNALGDKGEEVCSKLVNVWISLNEKSGQSIQSGFEAAATMRAIYQSLENSCLSAFPSLIKTYKLDTEISQNLIFRLISVSKSDSPVSQLLYNKLYQQVSARLSDLINIPDEITVEEVKTKVEAFSEEDKEKYNEVVAKGAGEIWTYICFAKGIKEYEKIMQHVEEPAAVQIYKLGPIEDCRVSIVDLHGSAEIFQNNLYQLVIKDSVSSKKEYGFNLPSSIFHNNKYFIKEITVRFVIEGQHIDDQLDYGFSIGDLILRRAYGKVSINGESFASLPTSDQTTIRINASSDGAVAICCETTQDTWQGSFHDVFTGVKIGEAKLWTDTGSAFLLYFEVFDAHVDTALNFKAEKAKGSEGGERFVKIKKKSEDPGKSRIKLLGITDEEAETALNQGDKLSQAVAYSFSQFTPMLPKEAFEISNLVITELKLFDSIDKVPTDFTVVKCIENFESIELLLPNRRILACKRAENIKGVKALTAFSVVEENGGETVGDLSIGEEDRPNVVYSKIVEITPKETPIRDIVFIKANSLFNVRVPASYEVVTDKEGKAINLALKTEKDYYLFIAVTKALRLLTTTISLLENVPIKNTTFGLSESSKSSASGKKEDSTDYSNHSILELYSSLLELESSRRSAQAYSLAKSMLNDNSSLILYLSTYYPLSQLLSFVNAKAFLNASLFSTDFKHKLLSESLTILISSLVNKSGGRSLNKITIESTHPYDNSMDVDDVIQIPGAAALRIEFDPQCYTESSCDPLRFYENSGRQGELKIFSGQGESIWQPFEVTGDTVYTYFHSDGSVNYWGYKFDVIPLGGSGGSGGSQETFNTEAALNIIKTLIKDPDLTDFVASDKFLSPIYIYLLATTSAEEKTRILDIMRFLFSSNVTQTHRNVLKSLASSALKLYNSTKADKTSHSILQAILMLMSQVQHHTGFTIEDSWFLDLSDLLTDMHGLTFKDPALELFLFESYKSSGTKPEKELESVHPYQLKTLKSFIEIPGAHSLNIDFLPECKAEDRHTAHFTLDEEGKKDVEAESSMNSLSAIWSIKGPDVVVDQDDKRVTRTNSNGWGCVISDMKINKGVCSISFFVENTGGSAYLYLGLIEADEGNNYELSTCANSDNAKRVWTWKQSGELHIKGSMISGPSFDTGDTVTFLVNSSMKTIICLLNTVEVHTFTDIADNVVPIACFGGSNQFVVIKKVETIGMPSLEGKKVMVRGDKAYIWFPVNTSAKLTYKWDYQTNELGSLSSDKQTATKLGEASTVFPTITQLQWGVHYLQVRVNKPGKVTVGLMLSSAISADTENPTSFLQTYEECIEGDLLAVLADIDKNDVKFYKNSENVNSVSAKLEKAPYKFAAVLYEAEQSLSIIPGHPEEINLLNIDSEGNSSEWGYKIKVSGDFKGRSFDAIQSYMASSTDEFKFGWTQYRDKFSAAFKSTACEELVSYIDQFAASKGLDPLAIKVETIEPSESELIYYPELEKFNKEDIKKLFTILQNFNTRINNSLYLFDLSISDSLTDMQKVLFGSRSYIFFKLKNDIFKKALDKSKTDTRTEINVDRPKAARHRQRKEVDSDAQFSNFGQIFRAMATVDNRGFRNAERIYKINYKGEASIDAGGPYNESMSNICDELQSSFLRLFVPVQNNVHNMGENREAWIVNPSANSPLDLELFLFLGKLMGAAIRTQNNLNLSLPPLFWKKLLHERLTISDLRSMDVCAVQIIEILKNPAANELTRENFESAYEEKFVTKDSAGKEVELIEGGREKTVTFDNCAEYADLVVASRLNESAKAYEKIREGMSVVVPVDYLNLFSWRQLETLVCGTVDIDIDVLKINTDYEGCGLSDQHIQYFWEVLSEFNQREKSLYLKFVWGRSRLPSGLDWRHMKVTRSNPNGPVNNYLPVSHTCFFTLDLPAYTTKDSMRQKLLYAITHCTAIDLDGSAGAGWEDND